MIEQTINIERMEDVIDVFGSFDENIKLIERFFQFPFILIDQYDIIVFFG